MRRASWYRWEMFPSLLAVCLAVASVGHEAYATGAPRVVDITARRFGFAPDQVTLKKGETVTLRLHSEDVTHGLFMRKLKIDTEVEAGQTTDVTITPETAGS
jgi:cytochrome c oxidase subunit II